VSIKSFPDYKHLLHENYVEYKLFFKCNSTREVFLQHISTLQQKYVCIPSRFLEMNDCNQGKTLFLPCNTGQKNRLPVN